MARTRRQPSPPQSEEFKCPECGRSFTRAAALGAHRRRAHGVVGSSAQARAKSARRSSSATRQRTAGRASTARAAADGSRVAGGVRRDGSARVDRDALLQAIFPGGVPAREAVIRAANAWLDEAERLAKLK
jgi:Zinc finger, C2H2 type